MDDEAVPVWHIDPSLRASLRLGKAQAAMEREDFAAAAIEAEELLDEEPENTGALAVLAEALLEGGDAEGAQQAFEQLITLTPARPEWLSGLAIARFDQCDLTGAREAAREALQLDPALAEAHYYLGLTQERLPDGKLEAITSFASAQQLDPAHYPFPLEIDAKEWEPLVHRALVLLPQSLQQFWSQVPIELHALPDLDELRNASPPITPTVTGLYSGDPPGEDDDPWQVRPDTLRLFAGNLARCRDLDELVEAIARTMEHEARDWLDLADDELP